MAQFVCTKCGRAMDETNFYTYHSGEKVEICKKCLTMHIDNFDPSTFLWAVEKLDVPYVEEEWNALRDKAFAKNPHTMNGMSVFGKYLSKMKLKQWKDYRWADTERLKAEKEARLQKLNFVAEDSGDKDKELRAMYEAGSITESEYRTLASSQAQINDFMGPPPEIVGANNFYNENDFLAESELTDVGADLTKEDKLYLAMKWGRLYKPAEWVALENDYKNMMESFDIHDADTKNALIHLCKTNLKMNQAIDVGDLDGYQKLSRVYNDLRKSAKFTAAQNKQQETQVFDAVGAIVAFCEKEGGAIPRYKIDTPLDKADEAIADLKQYNKNLIYNDTNLAQQIENYLKQLTLNQQAKEDREKAKNQGLDYVPLTDDDMQKYAEMLDEQQADDKALLEDEE